MTRPLYCLTLALAISALTPSPSAADAPDSPPALSGYVRSFATYTSYPGQDIEWAALETRVRLKLSEELTGSLRAELAYELAPVWRENAPPPPAPRTYQGFLYRAGDLKRTLSPGDPSPGETLRVEQNLDRAFISYRGRRFDLHAGRQPVAFGSARTVNPTDVLAPYTFDTLAKEERIGVDALRVKVPLGKMSELDMGAVFGDDLRTARSAAFFRVKGYALGTDVSAMAMRFRENSLYGLDVSRSIGGAGAWLEAARVFTNTPGNDYYSLSAGAEYFFSEKLYASAEYHRNTAGTGTRRDYIFNADQEAYTVAGAYLLARNYIIPGLSYQLTPLAGLSLRAICNMDDGSALLSPALEYNASENVYLGLGGFAGIGDRGGQASAPSEFGLYPDLWYTSASYYF